MLSDKLLTCVFLQNFNKHGEATAHYQRAAELMSQVQSFEMQCWMNQTCVKMYWFMLTWCCIWFNHICLCFTVEISCVSVFVYVCVCVCMYACTHFVVQLVKCVVLTLAGLVLLCDKVYSVIIIIFNIINWSLLLTFRAHWTVWHHWTL